MILALPGQRILQINLINAMRMKLTGRWSLQIAAIGALMAFFLTGLHFRAYSRDAVAYHIDKTGLKFTGDTLKQDTVKSGKKKKQAVREKKIGGEPRIAGAFPNDTVSVPDLKKSPYISLQQYLKGNVAGVYIQENNGEPGTVQNMSIRGIATPLFSNRDVTAVQPAVYVNGLPLIQNHPFSYDIKQYDINPLGTGNNLFAGIDLNNVVSIEVIKNPARLAQLGPLAANGAIWIISNDASNTSIKEKISINVSSGFVMPPATIRPTNASYEKAFRKQFYDAYNLPFTSGQLPLYFQDTSAPNYYGNADWADAYYNMSQQYNADASVSGGGNIANFLFKAGSTKNAGVGDHTSYSKNNISFFVNMKPLEALQMKAMIYGGTASRDRNKNLRDRYAETEYFPDLTTPIAPGGDAYRQYLSLYDETVDQNTTNYINGYLKLDYQKNKVNFGADLLVDYNVDIRHLFLPSTLQESMSFVSDYSGFNSRVAVKGYGSYAFDIDQVHQFNLRWDGAYYGDVHHYNYTKAYDGSSDKYKTTTSGSYITYNYLDKEQSALLSSSFNIGYDYKDLLSLTALLRYDGYSNVQPDQRWLFTPAFAGKWNLKNQFFKPSNKLSDLSLGISWARVGKLLGYDRFSVGPNYTSGNLNWDGQPAIPSYNMFATATRPYASGWSAYDIDWPYADKFNIDLVSSFFKKRLDISISLYHNDDKNMIMPVAVPQEFGYQYQYLTGMHVSNVGADLTVSGKIFSKPNGLDWTSSFNMNYNKNELKELPNGQTSLVFGDRMLQVGQAIDQFWVYENQGVYQAGEGGLSMFNVPFQQGDARWVDANGDSQIDEQDKVLKGHSLPKFTGGLNNHFRYKKLDLSFQLFFALGHDALNIRDARHYDFTTMDGQNSLNALKEIYFWQNTNEKNDYPVYNPASELQPYREDQDLFLEKLSFLKLRSVSIGYSFDTSGWQKKKTAKKANDLYLYLVGNNLWTLSNFSGGDPELVDFNGYYTGYNQILPLSLTMGLRYKF